MAEDYLARMLVWISLILNICIINLIEPVEHITILMFLATACIIINAIYLIKELFFEDKEEDIVIKRK